MSHFGGRVGFAIGTGRCGTKFIARILDLEPGVSSVHERNRVNEAFHRYCAWYGLPVDDEGFLRAKAAEIRRDLNGHRFSFESSAHLSLSVRELYERFDARFILLVRRPDRVVNSYLRKGWYDDQIVRSDPNLALGYQETEHFHHFLGRIVPSGDEFLQWKQMTRVGKLAWYWNALNAGVLQRFAGIPKANWRIAKLEELSHSRYLEIARFLGIQPTVEREAYERVARRRPNAFPGVPTISQWDRQEATEFQREVAPMAEELGYEYVVGRLDVPELQDRGAILPEPRLPARLLRIIGSLAERIHTWCSHRADRLGGL